MNLQAYEPSYIDKMVNKIKQIFHKEKFEKSNYYRHAIQEFKALGYIPPNEEQEDGPNKWIQENVLELLEVLSKQGHSGTSIHFLVNYFSKLALFEPLSPIMCTDDEWTKLDYMCESPFQNKRLSSVFKDGVNGKPYYLNAIVWREENGSCFTGLVEDIHSGQYIKIPFTPKTFYIDVLSWEVDNETNEPKEGTGWWEHKIKNPEQLEEVWKYYDKM